MICLQGISALPALGCSIPWSKIITEKPPCKIFAEIRRFYLKLTTTAISFHRLCLVPTSMCISNAFFFLKTKTKNSKFKFKWNICYQIPERIEQKPKKKHDGKERRSNSKNYCFLILLLAVGCLKVKKGLFFFFFFCSFSFSRFSSICFAVCLLFIYHWQTKKLFNRIFMSGL